MRDILRLAALIVVLVALFGTIERLWPLRPQKFFRKAFGTDLIYYFVSGVLPKLLLILPLTLLTRVTHHFLGGGWHEFTASLPMGVRLVAAALATDIGSYWGHRWSHEIPWLWRFHAIHHSAEEIDWLVNSRAHPVDIAFTRLCGYVPMYVLGLAQPLGNNLDLVPVLVTFLGTLWGFFIHANVRWRFGWLEWALSTPAFHHWHHNHPSHIGDSHINKNYAALLPLVDRMFGTYFLPKHDWPEKYGTDTPVSGDFVDQMWQPLAPGDGALPDATLVKPL